jgi:hypothetical protein
MKLAYQLKDQEIHIKFPQVGGSCLPSSSSPSQPLNLVGSKKLFEVNYSFSCISIH